MADVLVVDDSRHDGERILTLLAQQGLIGKVCTTGSEAQSLIEPGENRFQAAMIQWDIRGTPSGFELLAWCRQRVPGLPVIVMSGTLDASLAARAFALGARDFLEKPLDSERVKSCFESLLALHVPLSPLVMKMREWMIGESTSFVAMLAQVAQVIPHEDLSVLFVGESGTGKELLAQAVHKLSSRAENPWVAVNVGEIAPTLVESSLFGHEKGAYTGATERHIGFLEEAGEGTLFLDEIGDLELSLQGKLLRVLQEKEFRRLHSQKSLEFKARVVCATNRDLVAAVNEGGFRRDLYHRIAGVTIQVPALRERQGDVDLLLRHFLNSYSNERTIRFAREALTILRSYSFPGNIREMDNIVRSSIIATDGEYILPRHLPLQTMGGFSDFQSPSKADLSTNPTLSSSQSLLLVNEIEKSLTSNWINLPYKEAILPLERAFDRIYLSDLLDRARHNITRAASDAGIDVKTFRKRWKESGLPPLGTGEETSNG